MSEVSTFLPAPVFSLAYRAAATPRAARTPAPTLGNGCITWTGPGRKDGWFARMPMRAMTMSSSAGWSLRGPSRPYAVMEQCTRPGLVFERPWYATRRWSSDEGGRLSIRTSQPATSRWKPARLPPFERVSPDASGPVCASRRASDRSRNTLSLPRSQTA